MSSVPAGVLFVLDRPRSRSGLRDGRSTNRVRPKGRTLGTGKTTWVQFGSIGFTDVPRTLYTQAMLGVYELNDVSLLKDVFIWAYGRSAEQYVAVRQSLGEPDPFRFKQRAALRQVVGDVVRERLDRKAAAAFLTKWIEENIVPEERDRFREMAETDLLNIHEGNFARYQIRPAQFTAWQEVWSHGSER